MTLHRDIGVSQACAWFMLHCIREACSAETDQPFAGPAEVDETYLGGMRCDMTPAWREKFHGCGVAGKTAGARSQDRATNRVAANVVRCSDKDKLRGFVAERTEPTATVYPDESRAYNGPSRRHEAVRHSVGEYVRG